MHRRLYLVEVKNERSNELVFLGEVQVRLFQVMAFRDKPFEYGKR